ncbi:MAG: hypothetical protein KDK30_13680, partial [Leptospiraceae bacterium]|nr:hypothetical protein [Leptospiraceae bacterium]
MKSDSDKKEPGAPSNPNIIKREQARVTPWVPDDDFERADFPVPDTGSAGTPTSGVDLPGLRIPPSNPSAPDARKSASPPASRKAPRSRPPERTPDGRTIRPAFPTDERVERSTPQQRSSRTSDDSSIQSKAGGLNSDNRNANGPGPGDAAETRAQRQAREMFPGLFLADRKPRKLDDRLQNEHRPDAWQPRHISRAELEQGRNDPTQTEGGGAAGFNARIFREMVLGNREAARHILRHWYWQKPGQQLSPIDAVHPHDRIYIVMTLLGAR